MKRFRFRLEAALKHRDVILDNAKVELNEVSQRLNLAEELLSERQDTLRTLAQRPQHVGASLDPGAELIKQRHMHVLRDEVSRREKQVQHLTRVREERRLKVIEAHRDLKALEILKERDRAQWLEEARKQEQKETDDRNSARYGRSF